ncbi:MAG: chorismate synthase [Proteobacteria bacterium]|nr:chorismate synthase [Pseudomonadota bacterium]
MSSSTGHSFRITTFGESHGKGLGVIIDGCLSRVPIDFAKIQHQLHRRRPGTSSITSQRQEKDEVICLSGIENGLTLGSPVALHILNTDAKPKDYSSTKHLYRPSHADYTWQQKFHILPASGGGRASARETVARVAGGAVAEQMLKHVLPAFEVVAYVTRVGKIAIKKAIIDGSLSRADVDQSLLRCPEPTTTESMLKHIKEIKNNGDSVGGEICCCIKGVPSGLGEPIFDKLEADLAKAIMSIPACRYFSIGDGIEASQRLGSENNDALMQTTQGTIERQSNHSGGIEGGISHGGIIYFYAGFKPPSTIFQPQTTLTHSLKPISYTPQAGRHDPCVLPRAVPIVEAMASLVMADHFLRHHTQHGPSHLSTTSEDV